MYFRDQTILFQSFKFDPLRIGVLGFWGSVEVDLENGIVSVSSESELDTAQVAAAIDEAGYELVST